MEAYAALVHANLALFIQTLVSGFKKYTGLRQIIDKKRQKYNTTFINIVSKPVIVYVSQAIMVKHNVYRVIYLGAATSAENLTSATVGPKTGTISQSTSRV